MNRKYVLGILSIFALMTGTIFLNTVVAEKNSNRDTGIQPLGVATPLLVEDFTYRPGIFADS